MNIKICKKCLIEKSNQDFTVNNREKDGLDRLCRDCTREKNRQFAENNKEKRAAYNREYRAKNPEAVAEAKRRYVAANREHVAEKSKKYREENREELIAYIRNWRKNNKANRSPESVKASIAKERIRYHTDAEYNSRVKENAKKRWLSKSVEERKAINRTYSENNKEKIAAHRIKNRDKRLAYGANYRKKNPMYYRIKHAEYRDRRNNYSKEIVTNEFISHLHHWQDAKCYYCGDTLNKEKDIEHIIPLSRNGKNAPGNIVMSCHSCNVRKHAKIYSHEWNIHRNAAAMKIFNPTCSHELANEIGGTIENGVIKLNGKEIIVMSSFSLSYSHPTFSCQKLRTDFPDAILIWDHEWQLRSDATINVLKAKCGMHDSEGARKFGIDLLPAAATEVFMDQWHIQGSRPGASVILGLIRNEEIYGAASFTKRDEHIELTRMAFRGSIMGGVSKLILHFQRHFNDGLPIVSYCDPRFGEGNGYLKVGFTLDGESRAPSYGYVNPQGIENRLKFARTAASSWMPHYREDKSESENAEAHGYRQLFGLKQKRYILYS
ncbi:MAG: HNH endonuclease [Acidiphilium sp.]|nr:HNH endonuclease [Acidiphilium sp.]